MKRKRRVYLAKGMEAVKLEAVFGLNILLEANGAGERFRGRGLVWYRRRRGRGRGTGHSRRRSSVEVSFIEGERREGRRGRGEGKGRGRRGVKGCTYRVQGMR